MPTICQFFSSTRPAMKQLFKLIPSRSIAYQNTTINSFTMREKSLKYLTIVGTATTCIVGSIIAFSKSNKINNQLLPQFTAVHAKSLSPLTDLTYSEILSDRKSAVFRIEVLGDAINKASLHSGVLVDSTSGLILSESIGEVGSKVKVTTVDQGVVDGRVVAVDLELSLIQLEQPVSDLASIPVSKSSCSLGQRVISAGWDTKTGLSVCPSVVSSIRNYTLECVLLCTNEHRGGALLNMDGELVGIIGPKTNNQSVIGVSLITEFLQNNLPSIQTA